MKYIYHVRDREGWTFLQDRSFNRFNDDEWACLLTLEEEAQKRLDAE